MLQAVVTVSNVWFGAINDRIIGIKTDITVEQEFGRSLKA